MIKKYLFYLFRWQLSTPILAGVLWLLAGYNSVVVTVIANLIGGLIFFWIDRLIFKPEFFNPLWEIKDNVVCHDCGASCKGYRLVKTKNYDRMKDANPQFRCEKCSDLKLKKLKSQNITV